MMELLVSGEINASLLQNANWASPLAIGGTAASTGKFTTLEATNTGNALTLSGAGANIYFSGAGVAQITTVANQNLALMPGGTGMVGIGTTAPGALLSVKGASPWFNATDSSDRSLLKLWNFSGSVNVLT